MTDFPINPPLPDDVLARRAALPTRFAPVTLEGKQVRLEPLDAARHGDGLYAVANGQAVAVGRYATAAYDPDTLIWRYLSYGPFASAEAMTPYLRTLIDAPNGLALCVLDAESGRPVGVLTYMNNVPEHLKVELGNIWYSPVVQRSKANLEATYLTLRHAFALGYRRLEWKCDALNERSRRSALRMGFRFEGIQECHMIIKGHHRDTAWFRILDHEWPEVRARLEALLAA